MLRCSFSRQILVQGTRVTPATIGGGTGCAFWHPQPPRPIWYAGMSGRVKRSGGNTGILRLYFLCMLTVLWLFLLRCAVCCTNRHGQNLRTSHNKGSWQTYGVSVHGVVRGSQMLCTDENTIDIKATVACGEDGR